MPDLLSREDGWYEIPKAPQQHYFFKTHSLCGKYEKVPMGGHHDNVPLRHCQKCTQTLRKLLGVASAIAGKKMSPRQVFNLIETLEKIDLSKGVGAKEVYPEAVVAVVASQKTGESKTYQRGHNLAKSKSTS